MIATSLVVACHMLSRKKVVLGLVLYIVFSLINKDKANTNTYTHTHTLSTQRLANTVQNCLLDGLLSDSFALALDGAFKRPQDVT